MGLSSSSDEWCRHSDRVVEGLLWCKKIVDDILIWATTPSELDSQVVQRCRDLHITLSKSKFQIDTSLKFAGCVVSASGVMPDPDRISALANNHGTVYQAELEAIYQACKYVDDRTGSREISGCR